LSVLSYIDPALALPIPTLEEIGIPITSPVKEGPPDLIPGLLPRKGQLVIAGETNVGKSLVALEICSSLVTGNNLWGELTPNHKAKRILYVLGEHYNEIIQRLWGHTGLPMTDEVWLLGPEQLGYDKWLVAQGKPNQVAIQKLVKWAKGADLIVFDPLAAFVTGIDVENDNVQMRLVLDTMSLISQQVGASCIVLAHQGKPTIGRDGGENHRKSYAIRGASAVEDAATNIFYMNRAEGSSAAAAETKEHKIFTLKLRKYKGAAPDEYRLMRHPASLQHTLLGNRPFTEVRAIETQGMAARVQNAFPDIKHTDIVKIIAAAEGVSESTIKRRIEGR